VCPERSQGLLRVTAVSLHSCRCDITPVHQNLFVIHFMSKPNWKTWPENFGNRVPWGLSENRVPWGFSVNRVPWGLSDNRVPWDCLLTGCRGVVWEQGALGLPDDRLPWGCLITGCLGIAWWQAAVGLSDNRVPWDCLRTGCHGGFLRTGWRYSLTHSLSAVGHVTGLPSANLPTKTHS
jgi:hypothetical protein